MLIKPVKNAATKKKFILLGLTEVFVFCVGFSAIYTEGTGLLLSLKSMRTARLINTLSPMATPREAFIPKVLIKKNPAIMEATEPPSALIE